MTMTFRQLQALLAHAKTKTEEFAPTLQKLPTTMLSPPEAYSAYLFCTRARAKDGLVVELGAYTGGTTCLFGEALREAGAPPKSLEVYDFFRHNPKSRRRLRGAPFFDNDSFFGLWEHNTSAYREYIEVFAGDLRDTATMSTRPIEMLYVDVVKHASLINPVMHHFMRRLNVGTGLLFHQDYFHWQSPWVVYAMEKVRPYFEEVGQAASHALIFRLIKPIPEEFFQLDYVNGISWEEKMALMDIAIARRPALRAALLTVGKLNLGLEHPDFDFDLELERVRPRLTQPRVLSYVDALLKQRETIRKTARTEW